MKNNRFKLLTILISVTVFCALGFLVVLAGQSVHNKSLLRDLKEQKISIPEGFTVTAQTGCMNTVENSYISAKTGILYGAQAIEADVNFRKDGTPVLAAKSSEADENAVELERVFEYLVKNKTVSMILNLKQVTNLEEIEFLAKKYDLAKRIMYTGVTEDQVSYVRYASPNIRCYIDCSPERNKMNDAKYLRNLVETATHLGASGINVDNKAASKTLIQYAHSRGLKVSVYNVNDELDMYNLLSLNVDNIITKKPDLLLNVIHEIQSNQKPG